MKKFLGGKTQTASTYVAGNKFVSGLTGLGQKNVAFDMGKSYVDTKPIDIYKGLDNQSNNLREQTRPIFGHNKKEFVSNIEKKKR